MSRERALLDALRARPNERATKALRSHLEAFDACGHGRDDRLAINAIRLLIELNERVNAVLADHGAGT